MEEIAAFKGRIFKYGVIAGVIFEAVSLPFLGLSKDFAYGLALGTAVSIVNFNIMELILRRILAGWNPMLNFPAYLFRMLIYGIAFYMAMRMSRVAGLGAVLGFVTLKTAIYFLHGFTAK
ncbi:MAG: ATP synthase subunit I [Clostridiales Family XIII bacterium]|jgi:hypothetical protein|nr:ATP synthase subunit I [Clostridiales Family XIII bacterium]